MWESLIDFRETKPLEESTTAEKRGWRVSRAWSKLAELIPHGPRFRRAAAVVLLSFVIAWAGGVIWAEAKRPSDVPGGGGGWPQERRGSAHPRSDTCQTERGRTQAPYRGERSPIVRQRSRHKHHVRQQQHAARESLLARSSRPGVFYATIKGGNTWGTSTYLTHPWVVTNEAERGWGVYYPTIQPRTVAINVPE